VAVSTLLLLLAAAKFWKKDGSSNRRIEFLTDRILAARSADGRDSLLYQIERPGLDCQELLDDAGRWKSGNQADATADTTHTASSGRRPQRATQPRTLPHRTLSAAFGARLQHRYVENEAVPDGSGMSPRCLVWWARGAAQPRPGT
jgi:hypothetical protein